MSKVALMTLGFLVAASGFAIDAAIPYNISCLGPTKQAGLKINVHFSANELTRQYVRGAGTPAGGSIAFEVGKFGPQGGGKFLIDGVGKVAFAGGGSLSGRLEFNESTGVGTWKETISTFDEATGTQVRKTETYKMKCVMAQ